MSDRHDLRRQTREIQDALSRYEREQLIDILVHVFRTYVLEGAALSSSAAVASVADELQGLSFTQVIERLQLRLDLPELQLFEVQGGRVHVRTDGRSIPIELPAARGDGPSHLQVSVAPAASSAANPTAPPPRAPGVEVREVVMPPSPAASATQSASSRPEPRPGSVRATSAASSANARPAAPASPTAAPAASPSPAAASPPAASPPAPAKAERPPEPTGTSGGGRFGLLEID